jgi:hypothetical protein
MAEDYEQAHFCAGCGRFTDNEHCPCCERPLCRRCLARCCPRPCAGCGAPRVGLRRCRGCAGPVCPACAPGRRCPGCHRQRRAGREFGALRPYLNHMPPGFCAGLYRKLCKP